MMTQVPPNGDDRSLKKKLTVFDSVCIVIGSVIGSGIFVSPTKVFSALNSSPLWALGAWIVAALISLAGALCYAELGCMFPKAGAEYEYLKNGIGRFWGFLFAWTQLIVLGTGSIAIMSIIGASYFVQALFPGLPNLDLATKFCASSLVVILTLLNCFGIESGSIVQNVLTIVKLLGVAFLVGLGVVYFGSLTPANIVNPAQFQTNTSPLEMSFKFGSALIACLWAYDGWNNLSRVNEESVDIQKTLPRGLLVGVSLVAIVYLILNCLYFAILSPQQIIASKTIALSALGQLAQKVSWLQAIGASTIIGLIIAFSASGASNGAVLSGARIYFAAARDGLFFDIFSHTHHKTKAPVAALILQGAWSVVLICLGNFETLLDYFSFSAWLFYAASAGILMNLRYKQPSLNRPYKVAWYPFVPLAFLIAAVCLALSQIVNAPLQSGLSLLGVLSGVLFYFPFVRHKSKVG
jgi:amino acid transporter